MGALRPLCRAVRLLLQIGKPPETAGAGTGTSQSSESKQRRPG